MDVDPKPKINYSTLNNEESDSERHFEFHTLKSINKRWLDDPKNSIIIEHMISNMAMFGKALGYMRDRQKQMWAAAAISRDASGTKKRDEQFGRLWGISSSWDLVSEASSTVNLAGHQRSRCLLLVYPRHVDAEMGTTLMLIQLSKTPTQSYSYLKDRERTAEVVCQQKRLGRSPLYSREYWLWSLWTRLACKFRNSALKLRFRMVVCVWEERYVRHPRLPLWFLLPCR